MGREEKGMQKGFVGLQQELENLVNGQALNPTYYPELLTQGTKQVSEALDKFYEYYIADIVNENAKAQHQPDMISLEYRSVLPGSSEVEELRKCSAIMSEAIAILDQAMNIHERMPLRDKGPAIDEFVKAYPEYSVLMRLDSEHFKNAYHNLRDKYDRQKDWITEFLDVRVQKQEYKTFIADPTPDPTLGAEGKINKNAVPMDPNAPKMDDRGKITAIMDYTLMESIIKGMDSDPLIYAVRQRDSCQAQPRFWINVEAMHGLEDVCGRIGRFSDHLAIKDRVMQNAIDPRGISNLVIKLHDLIRECATHQMLLQGKIPQEIINATPELRERQEWVMKFGTKQAIEDALKLVKPEAIVELDIARRVADHIKHGETMTSVHDYDRTMVIAIAEEKDLVKAQALAKAIEAHQKRCEIQPAYQDYANRYISMNKEQFEAELAGKSTEVQKQIRDIERLERLSRACNNERDLSQAFQSHFLRKIEDLVQSIQIAAINQKTPIPERPTITTADILRVTEDPSASQETRARIANETQAANQVAKQVLNYLLCSNSPIVKTLTERCNIPTEYDNRGNIKLADWTHITDKGWQELREAAFSDQIWNQFIQSRIESGLKNLSREDVAVNIYPGIIDMLRQANEVRVAFDKAVTDPDKGTRDISSLSIGDCKMPRYFMDLNELHPAYSNQNPPVCRIYYIEYTDNGIELMKGGFGMPELDGKGNPDPTKCQGLSQEGVARVLDNSVLIPPGKMNDNSIAIGYSLIDYEVGGNTKIKDGTVVPILHQGDMIVEVAVEVAKEEVLKLRDKELFRAYENSSPTGPGD